MKSKVLLLALASMLAGGAMAQDCTFFFPTTKGTKLVKKSYDGKGNLSGVMTYVVDEVESKQSGLEVEADYVFVNNSGTVIDKGELEAFCQDGEFFMDMKEVLSNPSFVTTTNTAVAATDAVINYPSIAQGASSDDVYFDDAVINIYSKKNRKDRKNISIYDREYVKTEEITTPAGTFDCTKVKFKIKSRSPKETIEGYGYEWYAPNIGVVRTEQYNNNNVLQSYSVLEEVK